MSATVTTPGRAVRRTHCACGSEFGQTYLAKTQEHDSSWQPVCCAKCQRELLNEELAARKREQEEAEIHEEAERRAAADAGRDERIRSIANQDLMEEISLEVARLCAERRPLWEAYHADQDFYRVVAEIKAERQAKFLEKVKG
jgi:hypothetical protein